MLKTHTVKSKDAFFQSVFREVPAVVTIDRVDKRSLADRLGLRAGDRLVSLNGYEINDVLDYEFYAADSGLRIEYG